MCEILLQFKYNEIIRSIIINEPKLYEDLELALKTEVSKLRGVEFGIMYENQDGDYVVLNKDPRCLRLAIMSSSIVPGTDWKRLKLQIYVGHSPSHQKEKEVVCLYSSPSKSPLSKRVCTDSSTDGENATSIASYRRARPSKKSLDFKSSLKSSISCEGHCEEQHSTRMDSDECKYENSCRKLGRYKDERFEKVTHEAVHAANVTGFHRDTPFDRYVKKFESRIEVKEKERLETEEKLSVFNERIRFAKSRQGRGSICHHCHLRMNHTARNCPFDSCSSIFDCGEEKFHAKENVGKHYLLTLNKLKREEEEMRKELNDNLSASQKVKSSIYNKIESELLYVDNETYHESGVKNWMLLRRHVYALQCYCQKYLNSKIPPKHELLDTLEDALEEFSPTRKPGFQAKPRKRDFDSKRMLERHGVKFPERKMSLNQTVLEHPSPVVLSHLFPQNETEEEEQFNICVRESLRVPVAEHLHHKVSQSVGQTGHEQTTDCRSHIDKSVPETTEAETAKVLLSLSRLSNSN